MSFRRILNLDDLHIEIWGRFWWLWGKYFQFKFDFPFRRMNKSEIHYNAIKIGFSNEFQYKILKSFTKSMLRISNKNWFWTNLPPQSYFLLLIKTSIIIGSPQSFDVFLKNHPWSKIILKRPKTLRTNINNSEIFTQNSLIASNRRQNLTWRIIE